MIAWITTREKGQNEKGWDRGRLAGGRVRGARAAHRRGREWRALGPPGRERCSPPPYPHTHRLASACRKPARRHAERQACRTLPHPRPARARQGRPRRPDAQMRAAPAAAKRLKAARRGMRRRANAVWCAGRFLAGARRAFSAVRRRGGGRERAGEREKHGAPALAPSAAPSRACRWRPHWPRSPPWPPSARRRAQAPPPGRSHSSTTRRQTWTWRRARSRSTLTRP